LGYTKEFKIGIGVSLALTFSIWELRGG